ncbi:hypothetical protein BDP27DRAFT_1321194 [Rhodocollybia butyracea]|uniref:Uncharacterized protein n=1 Tax=Rhodocollybia butyracea TaxID=206335 RepID=A0A9P5Q0P3_9AGAR|nr:hypothetical protein BDP27DRAFT_1321194 [Rhodocollybia butyracea]
MRFDSIIVLVVVSTVLAIPLSVDQEPADVAPRGLDRLPLPKFLKPKPKYEGYPVMEGQDPQVDWPYRALSKLLFILKTGKKPSKPQIFVPSRQGKTSLWRNNYYGSTKSKFYSEGAKFSFQMKDSKTGKKIEKVIYGKVKKEGKIRFWRG